MHQFRTDKEYVTQVNNKTENTVPWFFFVKNPTFKVTFSTARSSHLATELVERATDGDTVHTTVHLENSEQRLEHTTEAFSGEQTSGECEGPEIK
jgi:hypothetical protein